MSEHDDLLQYGPLHIYTGDIRAAVLSMDERDDELGRQIAADVIQRLTDSPLRAELDQEVYMLEVVCEIKINEMAYRVINNVHAALPYGYCTYDLTEGMPGVGKPLLPPHEFNTEAEAVKFWRDRIKALLETEHGIILSESPQQDYLEAATNAWEIRMKVAQAERHAPYHELYKLLNERDIADRHAHKAKAALKATSQPHRLNLQGEIECLLEDHRAAPICHLLACEFRKREAIAIHEGRMAESAVYGNAESLLHVAGRLLEPVGGEK